VQKESFTGKGFKEHVKKFAEATLMFHVALGAGTKELSAFANAALSLDGRSNNSPAKPAKRK
jgi:hypothetical protein